jgi:hypothetical protein
MAQADQIRLPSLDDFVADLTEAAYPVALRRKGREEWLDLELDLWKALSKAVQKWERRIAQAVSPTERENADRLGRTRVPAVDSVVRRHHATLSTVVSLGN